MPCSDTSRPSVSASSWTRMPNSLFSVHRIPNDAPKVHAPTETLAHGATTPDAAVIATSAASTPFSIIEMPGFLRTIHAVMKPPRPPAAAAMLVVVATYAKKPYVGPECTESVEPGLKPNQPNQRM